MGWGSGTNKQGRSVGYNIAATCDEDGCDEQIDRGLAFVCGGMHDGDEHGCGGYFCHERGHLACHFRGPDGDDMSPNLCLRCGHTFEADQEPGEPVGPRLGQPVPTPCPATPGGTVTPEDAYRAFIADRCVELAAEGAMDGSDTLGGATKDLQAQFIGLKAELVAALPLPTLARVLLLRRIAERHWPDHPHLPPPQEEPDA